MQALERQEKFVGVLHIEPSSVVFYKENGLAILLPLAKFNAGGRVLRGEFPGISDQVVHQDADQSFVAKSGRIISNHEFNLTFRARVPEFGRLFLDHLPQVQGLVNQFVSADPG